MTNEELNEFKEVALKTEAYINKGYIWGIKSLTHDFIRCLCINKLNFNQSPKEKLALIDNDGNKILLKSIDYDKFKDNEAYLMTIGKPENYDKLLLVLYNKNLDIKDAYLISLNNIKKNQIIKLNLRTTSKLFLNEKMILNSSPIQLKELLNK